MAEAIVAKARAMYGRRLTPEDYNILLHCNSVGAVVAYLKGTERYRAIFSGVNETQVHRGQVEQMLSHELFGVYLKLCRFMAADKNSFCYYLIKDREIKEIITALMYVGSKQSDGYVKVLPAYFMEYASFDLMALANASSYDDVLDALAETSYAKALNPLLSGRRTGEINLEECGIALYVGYIHWAFKAIERSYKGKQAKELKDNFLKQADLDNIMTCYRIRKYFGGDAATVEKSLKPFHYRITAARLDEILASPDADTQLISIMKQAYFRNIEEYDPDNLEVTARRYNYGYYRKKLSFSDNGTMALYSIMILFEVERSNIQKIIEGIRYGIEPAEIQKMLVE